MGIGSRRSDSLAVGEALLVCLFLSTVIATFSTWIFYWVEGLHYASMFGSPVSFSTIMAGPQRNSSFCRQQSRRGFGIAERFEPRIIVPGIGCPERCRFAA